MGPKRSENQINMLLHRAERQLVQIAAQAVGADPLSQHIARASHAALHDTVVGLVTVFRDDVPGAAGVATRIARAYADGADAKAGVPTLACVHRIVEIVRQARGDGIPPVQSIVQ